MTAKPAQNMTFVQPSMNTEAVITAAPNSQTYSIRSAPRQARSRPIFRCRSGLSVPYGEHTSMRF